MGQIHWVGALSLFVYFRPNKETGGQGGGGMIAGSRLILLLEPCSHGEPLNKKMKPIHLFQGTDCVNSNWITNHEYQ
jgi:hypothetical protein